MQENMAIQQLRIITAFSMLRTPPSHCHSKQGLYLMKSIAQLVSVQPKAATALFFSVPALVKKQVGFKYTIILLNRSLHWYSARHFNYFLYNFRFCFVRKRCGQKLLRLQSGQRNGKNCKKEFPTCIESWIGKQRLEILQTNFGSCNN